jgi:2,3-bisphosphoglycerate-dependent phosphoglycerate mutase
MLSHLNRQTVRRASPAQRIGDGVGHGPRRLIKMHTAMLIVRHAQEAPDCCAGEADGQGPSLSAVGRKQAQALAKYLANTAWQRAVRIYHSPRRRCVETASVLAERLLLPRELICELRSLDPDSGPISPWDCTANAIGSIPPLVPHLPAVPGGEPWAQFVDRSGRALHCLFERHVGQAVIVVAHSGTVAAAMHTLAGVPRAQATRFYADAEHCSLTEWRRVPSPHPQADRDGQFVLKYLNSTTHLDPGQPHL